MNQIQENLLKIKSTLPEGVQLVAVSKFHPAQAVLEAYQAGQRKFGESRVQELLQKYPELPEDVEWHFIGHLQTNKVKQLLSAPVALIESVDSERLLDIIDRESQRLGKVTRVLMQVHVAKEETKFGFFPEELLDYFRQRKFENLRATHLCGVMGMASLTEDEGRIEEDFKAIAGVHRSILEMCPDLRGFDIVSMGMSDDYPLAIECGSNLVRVGTAIFGPRQY